MTPNRLRLYILFLCTALALSCGGDSSTPTAPSSPTPPRASLTLTLSNVSGERTGNGYAYRFDLGARETGGAAATLSAITVSFLNGDATFGSVTKTTGLPLAQVAANGDGAASWMAEDSDPSHPFATRLRVAVSYADTTGTKEATAVAAVPALPSAPTAFRVSGRARNGSIGVDGVRVEIVGTSRATTTDANGHYAFADVAAGRVTLRGSKSGWHMTESTVTVSGNTAVDLDMERESTPPSPPPPDPPSTPNPPSPPPPPTSGNICSANDVPTGTTAVCKNGQFSQSKNRSGTCSSNGGVQCWVCPGLLCKP